MKTNSNAEKVSKNAANATKDAASGKTVASDLTLTERRKLVRTIPAPEAVESDRDTDWALFQALTEPAATDKPN